MTSLGLDDSVPDWVIEHPQLLSLFEELGIDYSCGGKSLGFACREQNLNPQIVLVLIEQSTTTTDETA